MTADNFVKKLKESRTVTATTPPKRLSMLGEKHLHRIKKDRSLGKDKGTEAEKLNIQAVKLNRGSVGLKALAGQISRGFVPKNSVTKK